MASLAEASIVIALRDWQWIHRMAHDQFPDRYLALSGNAEKKLGDAFIRHDERLFLFELKSTEKHFSDEWKLRNLGDGKIQPRKSAYRWAQALAGAVKDGPPFDEGLRTLLTQSLQAHHFVYWSPDLLTGVPAAGHLALQPYFLGCGRSKNEGFVSKALENWNNAFEIAAVRPSLARDAPETIRYTVELALPLNALHNRVGRLIDASEAGSEPIWRHLGLPFSDFQSYVNSLCGDFQKAEEINVVILSDGGSFFAHLTSTDQLKTIFDPPSLADRIQHEVGAAAISDLPIAVPASGRNPNHDHEP